MQIISVMCVAINVRVKRNSGTNVQQQQPLILEHFHRIISLS